MPHDERTGRLQDPGRVASGEPAAARTRDVLVVVLTLTTGAIDAVTFLRLGKVFSSVITGNLALLGVSAGQHDAALALNGGLALAGYGVGVLLGTLSARVPERGQSTWPMRVTVTLSAELVVLSVFSALWLASGTHRGTVVRLTLLMIAAAANGHAVCRGPPPRPAVDHLPDQHADQRAQRARPQKGARAMAA